MFLFALANSLSVLIIFLHPPHQSGNSTSTVLKQSASHLRLCRGRLQRSHRLHFRQSRPKQTIPVSTATIRILSSAAIPSVAQCAIYIVDRSGGRSILPNVPLKKGQFHRRFVQRSQAHYRIAVCGFQRGVLCHRRNNRRMFVTASFNAEGFDACSSSTFM